MSRMDEIRARAEAATDGPWDYSGREQCGPDDSLVVYPVEEGGAIAYVQPLHADATFIAHARQDIPWLLARLEAVLAIEREVQSGYHLASQRGDFRTMALYDRLRIMFNVALDGDA